jgi:hypothetical protein
MLAVPLLLAGIVAAGAAQPGAPDPVTQIGSTEKICQLTGDTDWETGQPTPGRTLANFGLGAVDLGYPVEHDGKLILLFGDSWPPGHPPGAAPEVPPDDAVGITVRRAPPAHDQCLELKINERPGAIKRFAPATVVGPIPVKQGFFNVPSGGVSGPDGLTAFFWTDHCAAPQHLQPSPDDPLARPAPSPRCPETDERNSIGRGVMARSRDDARSFGNVVPMPTGFVYATAVTTALLSDLPAEQRLGIFIFGVPRYRASVPYLAQAPIATLADPSTWQFFSGRAPDGHPLWVSHDAWMRGTAAGAPRPQAWKPPADADILAPATEADRCVGEFSITWNSPLGLWLMLNQCEGRILARAAPAPWGPWSAPTVILDAERLGCRMVMVPAGCGNRRDFWPGKHANGKFVSGGLYAPYVLERYTEAAEGPGRRSAIYWVVSTWNPYEVTVMRTVLQSAMR